MRNEHLDLLVCPSCKSALRVVGHEDDGRSIKSGALHCSGCKHEYPIVGHIPRFVPLENYASGFGVEWTKHARTQHDNYSGVAVSETRFFDETRWPRRLEGETILEVGSGSGRFTVHAASTGAMVVSLDYSHAVEANYASNGCRDNVLIVQGDLYQMPFKEASFDKLFCFGVLQHTPDVKGAFMCLPPYLKPGGGLAIDVYRKQTGIKKLLPTALWVRPLTRRLPPERLYRWTERYVQAMWPVARSLRKLPRLHEILKWRLLVPDYWGSRTIPWQNMSDVLLKEWAVLDAFDDLSPRYISPQTLEEVKCWFKAARLNNVEVCYGYNGIEGRGTKP
jgi:uncharacterized protein YbaR (Trm112 family)/ubiquinone/menaquinone biosynthesis C-methylase UbiE